jgi:hypothetical protein
MENGYSGVDGKRGAYQVIVGSFLANAGVRVTSL